MITFLVLAWPSGAASAQGQNEDSWGDKEPPKDYVQSKEPAKDGHTYNWTQMAYASVVMAAMGVFLVWLIKNNKLEDDES